MEARLRGIALNLDEIRKGLQSQKAARALPRELSPTASGAYSPSKTDRTVKRSLSPTFAEIERLKLRRAGSPVNKNLPKRLPEDSCQPSGLSGINLPNSRTELISQYTRSPWEMPLQGRKREVEYHREAAERMNGSLKKHVLGLFTEWRRKVAQTSPVRRTPSAPRLVPSSPTFQVPRSGYPQVRKRGEQSANSSILPIKSSWGDEPGSSLLADIQSYAPSPKPLELVTDFSNETHRPPLIRKPLKLPDDRDLRTGSQRSSSRQHSLHQLPTASSRFSALPDLPQRIETLASAVEKLRKQRTGGAFALLAWWLSATEAAGRVSTFIHRRVMLRYQDFLYALFFIPSKKKIIPKTKVSAIRDGRRTESARKFLQLCGNVVISGLFETQRTAFYRIFDFARSPYAPIYQGSTVLEKLANRQRRAIFPIFTSWKAVNVALLPQAKYRLRACFRSFAVQRLKIITRYFARFRASLAQRREKRVIPNAKPLAVALVRVMGDRWKMVFAYFHENAMRGSKNLAKSAGKDRKLGENSLKKLSSTPNNLHTVAKVDKAAALKVRRLLTNVSKDLLFRKRSAFNIWKTQPISSESAFEASYIINVCEKLIKQRELLLFLRLKALKSKKRSTVNSESVLLLVCFLRKKVKLAQGAAFFIVKRAVQAQYYERHWRNLRKLAVRTIVEITARREQLLERSVLQQLLQRYRSKGKGSEQRVATRFSVPQATLSPAALTLQRAIENLQVCHDTQAHWALESWHSETFGYFERAVAAAYGIVELLQGKVSARQAWAIRRLRRT